MDTKELVKKFHYNSPVILTFALLSLAALVLGMLTGERSTRLFFSVYRSSPVSIFFYFRLFGHVLGHAGFEHYINNFIIILLIGPMLEEKYGSKKLAVMILFTALITGIIHLLFFNTALLGASGVAFMLILLSSYVNLKRGTIPITLILVVIAFLGREIIAGMITTDNISQLTHVLGGFCGGLFGFFFQSEQ